MSTQNHDKRALRLVGSPATSVDTLIRIGPQPVLGVLRSPVPFMGLNRGIVDGSGNISDLI